MILRLQGVSATLGDRLILDGVSVDVERGQTLALMGANGAGKTTLLRCVLGLVRHQGRIVVDGLDLARHGVEARRKIGYVPQVPAFYDMRAGEWLRFVARLRGASSRDTRAALERVGLEADADRPVRVFSGGMQQRLSVGAALLGNPSIILLDEPTANLDPGGRADLLKLLREFRGEGKTLVLSSHRAGEVRDLADRVMVLDRGRIGSLGPPSQVIPPERLGLQVDAPGVSEKRRIEGLLRVLDLSTLPSPNGTVNAVLDSGSALRVIDSLRSDGVEGGRIRLHPLDDREAP